MADFVDQIELLQKLRAYTETPDDDSIRFKQKIKESLLQCPELLYVLNNPDYEAELFDDDGILMEDGEWDSYFGDNIRPYLFFPETQTDAKNFVCYKIEFTDTPRENFLMKYGTITFVVLADNKTINDKLTGIARHDLIAAIIREKFNWSNIFGTQCSLVSDREGYTDNNFITRTLVFELTKLNGAVRTKNGKSILINNSEVRTT